MADDQTKAEALRIAATHLTTKGWGFSAVDIGKTAGLMINELNRVLDEENHEPTVNRCIKIATTLGEIEDQLAKEGAKESTGVNSPGWVKDALHSQGAEVAYDIVKRLRLLIKKKPGK